MENLSQENQRSSSVSFSIDLITIVTAAKFAVATPVVYRRDSAREVRMTTENKPSCEKCGSNLTVMFAHGIHCNACGADFGQDKNPVATAAHQRKSQGIRGGWQREPQK